MSDKKVTLKDVAKAAGVSLGTIDRAINGRTGIREDVRQKIFSTMQELGYKKNSLASSLSIKRKRRAAILYSMQPEFFWSKLTLGMEDAMKELESYGLEFITFRSDKGWAFSEEYILRCLDEVAKEKVDLLAMVAFNSPEVKKKLDEITGNGALLVSFTEEFDDISTLLHIGIDNYKCGRLAAELLCKFLGGRGNILIVDSLPNVKYLFHQKRVSGFRSLLEQKYPEVHVVGNYSYDERVNEEHNALLLKGILGSSAELHGIYHCDGSGLSHIGRVILELGKGGKSVVVGHEISEETAALLRDNIVTAVVSQDPYKQGHELVKVIGRILLHGEYPQSSNLEMYLRIILGENSDEQRG